MRTIVHLSDIHFGRTDFATIAPLIETAARLAPDLVAVSGDLTQRARTREFQDARAFLDALPQPQIVVPGNHDVPLHNVYARFIRKLHKYQRYITSDMEPLFLDSEIAVAGINTARSATWKGGRVSRSQVARVQHRLCAAGENIVKVIVTHHPFELPEGAGSEGLVGRAHAAMNGLASCGADLFLAGHLHLGYTAETAARYAIRGHSALVIQAGTATSTRGRGEANSFNVIRIAHPEVEVQRYEWEPALGQFAGAARQRFRRAGREWSPFAGGSIASPPSL